MFNLASTTALLTTGFTDFSTGFVTIITIVLGIGVAIGLFWFGIRYLRGWLSGRKKGI